MSTPPLHFLCLITSDREWENVDELTRDIWTHFDGIAAVVHRQAGNGEVTALLESRQGKHGFVIERDWAGHHGHSMNEWLIDQRIPAMSACWIRDSSERLNPEFTGTQMRPMVDQLERDHGVLNLMQWSKLLVFRRWYGQQFHGGLHWGLHQLKGHTAALEQVFGDQHEKVAYSVRNLKRPRDHRYRHECLYLLDYGLNGNHLALFHPDPADLDRAYHRLADFTAYLAARGVRGVDAYTVWLKTEYPKGLAPEVKEWVNAERPFRNHLRFEVLRHTHEAILTDEDTWRLT